MPNRALDVSLCAFSQDDSRSAAPSDDRRLYDLVNPSDAITFRATPVEAAVLAVIFSASMLFVKDAETGATPEIEDPGAARDAIWANRAALDSYADAFDSFLVGSRTERALIEEILAPLSGHDRAKRRAAWHDERRTSMNDICANTWAIAERLRATRIKEEIARG